MVELLRKLKRGVTRAVTGAREVYLDVDDLELVRRPMTIGAEITNICNAKCSFCGYGKKTEFKDADPRKKSQLDESVFRHSLELFSRAGGGHFSISPILGEVTTHPRWLELIKEARSYPNITGVSCFTNAILLDRFDTDAILSSGLTSLTISTNLTSKERYNALYGVDKFEIVLANSLNLLKRNRDLGRPVQITLNLRLDKPYEDFFNSDTFAKLAEVTPKSSIVILDDFWDDFTGLVRQEDLPLGQLFKENQEDKSRPCYALYRKLQVMMGGEIQACACRVEPELWAGNILDHKTLEDAWRNKELQGLRQRWSDGEIPDCCKRCSHYIPYTNLLSNHSYWDLMKIALDKALLKIGARQKTRISGAEAVNFDD